GPDLGTAEQPGVPLQPLSADTLSVAAGFPRWRAARETRLFSLSLLLRSSASDCELPRAAESVPEGAACGACPAGQPVPVGHAGALRPADDFDAPLPDDFWAGAP